MKVLLGAEITLKAGCMHQRDAWNNKKHPSPWNSLGNRREPLPKRYFRMSKNGKNIQQRVFASGHHLTTNPPVSCLNIAERTGSIAITCRPLKSLLWVTLACVGTAVRPLIERTKAWL